MPGSGVSYTAAAAHHPGARLAVRLTRPATTLMPALLVFLLVMAGPFDPRAMAVGRAEVMVDQEWWRIFTSHFSHNSWRHLIGNLPVLLYSCWRVERLFGTGTAILVAAAAMAGSVLMITNVSTGAVVGASTLAWGFCSAQVTGGIRYGEAIPEQWRRYYGAGTMIPGTMLFLLGLRSENISHIAHLGAIIGGALAMLVVEPETVRARGAEGAQLRQNLLGAAAVMVLPMLGMVVPERGRAEDVAGTGMRLEIPAWMGTAEEAGGVTVWGMAGRGRERGGERRGIGEAGRWEPVQGVFVGLEERGWGRESEGAAVEIAREWAWRTGLEAAPLPSPAPPGTGWSASAAMLSRGGRPAWIVVENRRYMGAWVYRLGYITTAGAPRERHTYLQRVLQTAEIGEPPDLTATRRAWERTGDVATGRAYAQELRRAGDLAAAIRLMNRIGWPAGDLEAAAAATAATAAAQVSSSPSQLESTPSP